MKAVENQKIVIVNKEASDKKHPYSIINVEAATKAGTTLSGNEFKLWFYIAKNQDGYSFALSRVTFCREMNVSSSTYYRAVDTLIEKGYLIQKEEGSNIYCFYENGANPIEEKDSLVIELPEEKIEELKTFKF
jgi:hypothetical protein